MKIERVKIGAVIPVQQYGNIQPEIEISSKDHGEDLISAGIDVMKDLFSRFSEKGSLVEKKVITVGEIEKSFNEDTEILYEPVSHTYFKDGIELISATRYIKKFYKEFDEENVSAISAKSWGVNQDEVKGLWKSNGELTSAFGKVVHAALEHYDKYMALGKTVQEKKKLAENYAMPKHPILKSIISGFIEINNIVGEVVPEALVTDVSKGFCGRSDRIVVLDREKKICRIGDYKINIDPEEVERNLKPLAPFETLPANKITKYQIQLSFYANLLEATGWTVEGLDIWVYDGLWKYYKREILKVI